MTPFWLQLLRSHNKSGGYGLSFPFIAGAYKHTGQLQELSLDTVKVLITSIATDAPDGSYTSLTICDRLNNPVFSEGTTPYSPSPTSTKILNPNNEKECILFVVPTILNKSEASIEELSNYLWNRYKSELHEDRFSFSKRQFSKFTALDIKVIVRSTSLDL